MTLTGKVTALRTSTETRQMVIRACSILQKTRKNIATAATKLQAIADSGSLNSIDDEVKAALVTGKNIVDTANSDFNTQDMVDLLTGHVSSECGHCGGSIMREVNPGSPEEPA